MRKASSAAHFLLICLALPVCMSSIAYYGFANSYSAGLYSEAGFREQYESGIYKYRVLGRYALLRTYDLVKGRRNPPPPVSAPPTPDGSLVREPQADTGFHRSYFLVNTVFLSLACMVLYGLLGSQSLAQDKAAIGSSVLVMTSLVTLSQFVVTPYDTLSYFLFLLGVYLSLLSASRVAFLGVAIALVLGTLTRETAALLMPAYFAIYGTSLVKISRHHLVKLALLALVFSAVYIGLRYWFGPGNATYGGFALCSNLQSAKGVAGLLLCGIVTHVLAQNSPNREACLRFLLGSAPYIVVMMLVAVTWEIRLWVPLWLGVFVVGRVRPQSADPGPVGTP